MTSFIDLSDFMDKVAAAVVSVPIFCCWHCCFCDSFSYSGFTFFKYFLITSLADELIRFTDDPDTLSDSRPLESFRNTEESLEKEKYLLFLICW